LFINVTLNYQAL